MIDFAAHEPQHMFLLHGDEDTFDELHAQLAIGHLVHGFSVPRFTIDHARSIVAFNLEGTGERRLYVAYFTVFSPEAAQVLLKTLEEPDPDTYIVFITPYPYLVPATVRSRVMLLPRRIERARSVQSTAAILKALKVEAEQDDEDASVRRGRAIALLDELETSLMDKPEYAQVLYKAKDMMFAANLPTKYVIDYITTVVR